MYRWSNFILVEVATYFHVKAYCFIRKSHKEELKAF